MPMPTRLLLPLLALLATAPASAQEPSAGQIFRLALRRQGSIRQEQIEDVHLSFQGQVVQDGDHAVVREYWFRARDQAFRIRTASKTDARQSSERGVLAKRYWERSSNGSVVPLVPGNREHVKVIRAIRNDRESCEQILALVLLTRLEDKGTRLALVGSGPVQLLQDEPFGSTAVFPDRGARYHVLRVERPNEPRLDLFVHAQKYTVHKVVQYEAKHPERPAFLYYFGAHQRLAGDLALTMPRWFSIHDRVPVDAKTKKATNKVRGEISIRVNSGLGDGVFFPESGKK